MDKVLLIIIGVLLSVLLVISMVSKVGRKTELKSKTISLGLKNIGELSTQAGYFTNAQLIRNAVNLWGWNVPLTQSKYIFTYDGVIKAGIDFESVKVNVNEDARTVHVIMPEVKILSFELYQESFVIFDETSNIFTPLKLDAMNNSLIELKKEAKEKAVNAGLLSNALANAELIMRGFLTNALGSRKYTILFEYSNTNEGNAALIEA